MIVGPIEYTPLHEFSLLFLKVRGRLEADDIIAYLAALREDPEYDRKMNVLVDLREVTEYALDTEDTRRVVEANAEHLVNAPPSNVYLVGGDDLVFGMSRMFQLMAAGQPNKVEVYRRMEVACAKARVPSDVIEKLQ